MACTNKARGSKFYFSTNSGGSYTQLTGLTSCQPPEEEVKSVEDDTLDDTSDTVAYCPGRTDPGKSSAKFKFNHSDFATLKTHQNAKTTLRWKLEFPLTGTQTTNGTYVWDGFITKCSPGQADTSDTSKWETMLEIQDSGLPTFTAGS